MQAPSTAAANGLYNFKMCEWVKTDDGRTGQVAGFHTHRLTISFRDGTRKGFKPAQLTHAKRPV